MCLVEYIVTNNNNIPYKGLIKIVNRAPITAEKNGINEIKVNSRFNLLLSKDLKDHILPKRKNRRMER